MTREPQMPCALTGVIVAAILWMAAIGAGFTLYTLYSLISWIVQ
jgi:hypothetical protein